MKAAIINTATQVVENITIWDDNSNAPDGFDVVLLNEEDFVDIGATYENGVFVLPASPSAPVPQSISFAQLLIGLVTEEWITVEEGEGWLVGTLPTPVVILIDTLPVEQRFAAKARAITPSVVLRNDPLVVALGAAQNKTPEEIDMFFQTYAGV